MISPDGKSAYSQSSYLKRIMYGDHEQVLQVFDVATLTPTKEVILPNKAAMVAAYTPLLEESADGKFIYVQNATPATSVTVVDMPEKKQAAEVPTPGCWGIFVVRSSATVLHHVRGRHVREPCSGQRRHGDFAKSAAKDVRSDKDACSSGRTDGQARFVSSTAISVNLDDDTAYARAKTVAGNRGRRRAPGGPAATAAAVQRANGGCM